MFVFKFSEIKSAARRFDTIRDILRSFNPTESLPEGRNAPVGTNAYEIVVNRRVNRFSRGVSYRGVYPTRYLLGFGKIYDRDSLIIYLRFIDFLDYLYTRVDHL